MNVKAAGPFSQDADHQSFYEWGYRDAFNGVPLERVPQNFLPALQCAWRTGWHAADWSRHRQTATELGVNAAQDATCPYGDPELARCWLWGWHQTHGLRAVRKEPASRMQPATPEAA